MNNTTPQLTAQEIFDKVVAHLRGMKNAAKTGGGDCSYRGSDGASCAVGCLIADEEYSEEMEGNSAMEIIERFPSLSRLSPHSDLLDKLQLVHDSNPSWVSGEGLSNYAERTLKCVAEEFSLTYTPRAEPAQ